MSYFDILDGAGWGDRPVGLFATVGAELPESLATEFTRRLNDRDVEVLLALYDSAAVFSPEPGVVVTGHEQIRAALSAMVDAGVIVDLELENIQVTGDQALITNKATVGRAGSQDSSTLRTTEVARRRGDGRWVYLIDVPAE